MGNQVSGIIGGVKSDNRKEDDIMDVRFYRKTKKLR